MEAIFAAPTNSAQFQNGAYIYLKLHNKSYCVTIGFIAKSRTLALVVFAT